MNQRRQGPPPLLPIFRSQQQGELLATVLDEPDLEFTPTALARRLSISQPTAHRELVRAEEAGVVRSRRVGRSRLFRANTQSPYFQPLRDLLVMAFGVPQLVARCLRGVPGVESAYIYGSWAARAMGVGGRRPVGDLDILVLGAPDERSLFERAQELRETLGREIQLTIRPSGWLEKGDGSFHDTVASRPLVQVLPSAQRMASATAPSA